jgi:hypothetical protein
MGGTAIVAGIAQFTQETDGSSPLEMVKGHAKSLKQQLL